MMATTLSAKLPQFLQSRAELPRERIAWPMARGRLTEQETILRRHVTERDGTLAMLVILSTQNGIESVFRTRNGRDAKTQKEHTHPQITQISADSYQERWHLRESAQSADVLGSSGGRTRPRGSAAEITCNAALTTTSCGTSEMGRAGVDISVSKLWADTRVCKAWAYAARTRRPRCSGRSCCGPCPVDRPKSESRRCPMRVCRRRWPGCPPIGRTSWSDRRCWPAGRAADHTYCRSSRRARPRTATRGRRRSGCGPGR